MKRKFTALLSIIVVVTLTHAQHVANYTQFMFNGLLLNPAYAGSHEALNVTALYRKQWVGMGSAPTNLVLSGHSPLRNKSVNVGAVLLNDRFGVYDHTGVTLMYAYRMHLSNGYLFMGAEGGIDLHSTNWSRIAPREAGDPSLAAPASSARDLLIHAGAGAFYRSKNFYLGLAAPNLFNAGFNPYWTTNLHSGCIIRIDDNIKLKPALLVRYMSHSPAFVNISSTLYCKEVLGIGLGYTVNNSALAYADIKLNDQLNFGYGYEYSFTKLQSYTRGTHEVMLRYLFRYKINAVNSRFF